MEPRRASAATGGAAWLWGVRGVAPPESAGGASDPLWTSASVWQGHVEACAPLPAGLTLLELCGGASTAQCALDLLLGEGSVQCVGCYDSAAECGPVARRVHRAAPHVVRVGSHGDILRMPLHRFPSANVVVSGPPCPPWSSMGSRRSLEDSRASVFLKVANVIIHLANREGQCRPLLCFVLENVEGFTHSIGGGASGFKVVSEKLQAELPGHWALRLLHMDSANYGLPQSRRRIYLVGRSGQWFPRVPVRPPVFGPTPPLRAFLRESVRGGGRVAFTRIQAQNLADWKASFAASMEDSAYRGQCAVVDLSRTPSGRTEWGGLRPREDVCQCLTASGPILHVFALGEGQWGQLSLDRLLLVSERGTLQGFPSRVANADLTEVAGRRIFGNAMSVPVIGSVMAVLIEQLLGHVSTDRLREAFARPVASSAASAGQQQRTPERRQAACAAGAASAGRGRPRSRSRGAARTPPLRHPPTHSDTESDVAGTRSTVVSAGQRLWRWWDTVASGTPSASGGEPETATPRAVASASVSGSPSPAGGGPGQCIAEVRPFPWSWRRERARTVDLDSSQLCAEVGNVANEPVPPSPVSAPSSDEVVGAAY